MVGKMTTELLESKKKRAKIHLKTQGLTAALLTLERTIGSLGIDEVLMHQVTAEVETCLNLNHQIRKLAED